MFRLALVLVVAAAATIAGWRLLDRELPAANVEGPLHGVTYAPWAKDQDPLESKSSGVFPFLRTAFTEELPPPVKPRKEQVERDFAMLAGKVQYVRTYRTTDGGEYMPELAARVGLKLVPGAWIYSANEAKQQFGRDASEVNAEETRALIRMANQNPNIERVLVGNENILRWDAQKDLRDPNATSPAQLIREIRNVKRNVKVPVSTAEPWHVWLHYPELAKEVDYVAVHILPYWDEQSSETPLEYLKDKIGQLKKAPYLQNKNIIVTEVGWPSNGASRRSPATGFIKRATPAEQARNVRDISVDPTIRRVLVRSEVQNPRDELRSGMFATFVIRTGAPVRSVAVPLDGVVREGDGTMTVWVTADRRRFTKRTVKVGLQQDGYRQIIEGVQPGELVATEGALFLSNALATASR